MTEAVEGSGAAAAASVVLVDQEPNGLAAMMADLLRANLQRRPERARLLRSPASFTITGADIGLSLTLRIADGKILVASGKTKPPPAVRVRGEGVQLLELSSVPLRFGFPDVCTPEGRAVLHAMRTGKLKVKGLVRHPGMVARLNRLLAVKP